MSDEEKQASASTDNPTTYNSARLRPEVIILSLVSLCNDAASEMIFPLLPLFITQVLGGTPFIAGAIEGSADALSAILKYYAGRISDRYPARKPFILTGYGLAAFARLFIAAAASWPLVFVARLLDRTGKGIRSAPRDAMIADVTPPEQRGRAFGLHRALDHTGAVIGPLVAAALMRWAGLSLRGVFYAALVPACVGLLLIVFVLKEEKRVVAQKTRDGQPIAALPRSFYASLASVGLFSLANSSDIFLLLQSNRAGVAAAMLPLLWSAHHVLKALLSERAGYLSDRISDRRWQLAAGWMLYAAIYFLFPLAHTLTAFFVLFIVYALPFAVTEGAERAWVVAPVEASMRGRAFGAYYLTVGLCSLAGSLLFGALYEKFGAMTAFGVGGAIAIVASLTAMAQRRG